MNQYMVHAFDSISIGQFSVTVCLISAEGSLNRVLTLSKSIVLSLSASDACLPLSLAYSDFSCLLRVMMLETRILCHFILI